MDSSLFIHQRKPQNGELKRRREFNHRSSFIIHRAFTLPPLASSDLFGAP